MSSRSSDPLCVNTIRFLAAEMVQNAYSGHSSAPLYSLLHLTGYDLTVDRCRPGSDGHRPMSLSSNKYPTNSRI